MGRREDNKRALEKALAEVAKSGGTKAVSNYVCQCALIRLEAVLAELAKSGGTKAVEASRTIEGIHRLSQLLARLVLAGVDVDEVITLSLGIGAKAQRFGLAPLIEPEERRITAHEARYGGSRKEKRKKAEELFKELNDWDEVARTMGVKRRSLNRWSEKK